MACDRPLAALDLRPGPYLPTGQLPVSLSSGAEVAVAAGQALGKVRPVRSCLQLFSAGTAFCVLFAAGRCGYGCCSHQC